MASTAISIPRKVGRDNLFSTASPSSSSSSTSSSSSSSSSSTAAVVVAAGIELTSSSPSLSENPSPVIPSSSSSSSNVVYLSHSRRPSLLSSSVRKVEHSVFDLGTRDGSPRLLTCVKASQGFDWNLDIFLPSSSDISLQSLSDRMEPVHEIVLTEEEGANMLPS